MIFMIKKILFIVAISFFLLQKNFAQLINIGNITTSGKLAQCATAFGSPIITCNFISGNGSSVVGGVLVCSDPCDSTILEISLSNLQWNKGPDDNWIHAVVFGNAGSGFTFIQSTLSPANWSYQPNGCTGACPTGGQIAGGAGWYFNGPGAVTACCPGGGVSTPSPCDNYGDPFFQCGLGRGFFTTYRVKLCNSVLNGTPKYTDFYVYSDGNTGCWSQLDPSVNVLSFTIPNTACPTLYNNNPPPTATPRAKTCLPTLNYTTTLSGSCGNSSTITWWTAAVNGTQVGSGSPFVYDPPGATCPQGTLYAACCPAGNTCANRKAVGVPGACAAPLAITSVAFTNPLCPSQCGDITATTITGAVGAVTYTLMPDNITNTTGIFPCVTGANHTLTVTDAAGCSASANVVFTIPVCGFPLTSPISYCLNSTNAVPLTATLAGTGTNLQWYSTLTGGSPLPNAPTPITTAVGPTTYYVTQLNGGVESTPRTPLVVSILALPTAPIVFTPLLYCKNAPTAPLTANGTNLLWYTALAGGGAGSVTAPTPSSANVGNTTYYVTQTVGTCESSPRTPIVVTVKPIAIAAISITKCSNEVPFIWNGQSLNTSGTFTNTQIGSNGCDSTTTLTFVVKPTATAAITISKCSNELPFIWNSQSLNAAGTFTNTQPAANGCDSITTLTFIVKPTKTAALTISKCTNEVPFIWNGQSLNTGGTFTNTQPATNGCDSTTTLTFIVKPTKTATITINKCSNEVPFIWNGQSLNIGGTYTNTQAAANGCDSTTTLTFIVKPTKTAAIAISKCSNTLPFAWNGQSLNNAGTYTNTQTSSNGCDSTTTLTFTVLPGASATVNVSVCSNAVPYIWNGQSLSSSGIFTNTQPGPGGCDSVTTLNFTIKPTKAVSISISKCSNEVPFVWNGQSLNIGGTYTNTQTGSNGCDSTTTLTFIVKPTKTATITINKCSNEVPFIWNGQSLNIGGTYTNTQAAANGCDSTTTLTFIVKPTKTAAIAISKCSNTLPFAWNGQSLNNAGTYTNTQTSSNGCDSTTTLTFTVLPRASATVNVSVCSNLVPYIWNGQSLTTSGTYLNTQVAANGCDSITTLNFVVKPISVVSVTISKCINTLPFVWNGQSLSIGGTYTNIQIGGNGCDSTTILTFIVKPTSTATISIVKCSNQIPFIWNGQSLNSSGIFTNTQIGINGCDSTTTLNFTVKPTTIASIAISKCSNQVPFVWNGQSLTASGTFTNTQTGSNGCDSTTTLTFTVKPVATASVTVSVCSNTTPYIWNGQSLTTSGTYANTQVAANGCDSITTLNFVVKPISVVSVTISKCINTLPFVWNGQSLSIGGTYTNIQIGSNGCDSTTTLIFIVKPIKATTITISKCINTLPFIWNGQSLNSSGTFTNTQISSNGCDSTTTLTFIVKPITAATITITKCSNQVPFVWNGQSLSATGTFTNTQTGSNGCDSTTTLTFTVKPVATASVTVSVCSNTTPYIWNGQSLTTSGTYTNTRVAANGCDSITTLNFTVKPTKVVSISISKCSNEVPFIWNGQSLNIGGTYTNIQTGINSCDSTTTLTFIIKPTKTAALTISKCSNEVPFVWNGQSLNIGGTYTNIQTSSNGCDSTTTLTFIVKPTKIAAISIFKCSNTLPFIWNGQSLNTAGIYTNTQTASNGCDSTTTLNFIVNLTPTAPITTDRFYCQNTIASVLTAVGANIKWYSVATGGSAIAAPIPSTLIAGATTYYASQTVNGCEGIRAPLVVTITATPPLPTVTSPLTYCPGDPSLPLTANGTNLLWYTNAIGGTGSSTAPTPITTSPGSFTYYVSQSTSATPTLSCEGPRTAIVVNVNNNNLSVKIGLDTTICEGETVRFDPLVVPNASSYEWRAIGVPANTIDSKNTKIATVNPVDNATYILKATNGGCSTEDTVNVFVRWKPIIDAGSNKAICLNDRYLLKANLTHFRSNLIDFVWTPADSLSTTNTLQTFAYPTYSTWYKITATTTKVNYGCDFIVSDSMKLVIQPNVKAFAGNDTIAVKGIPHQLTGTGGLNYSWSSPSGATISNPFSQKAFAILNNDANFYLKVSDAIGCTAFDSIFVKVYDGPTYYIPNSFSPNGDGLNDIFRAIPVGMANTVYFRVFDRYGQLVFETNQWLKGWDGTFNGKPQPIGTYIWTVAGTSRENKKVNMKGSVNIIR